MIVLPVFEVENGTDEDGTDGDSTDEDSTIEYSTNEESRREDVLGQLEVYVELSEGR